MIVLHAISVRLLEQENCHSSLSGLPSLRSSSRVVVRQGTGGLRSGKQTPFRHRFPSPALAFHFLACTFRSIAGTLQGEELPCLRTGQFNHKTLSYGTQESKRQPAYLQAGQKRPRGRAEALRIILGQDTHGDQRHVEDPEAHGALRPVRRRVVHGGDAPGEGRLPQRRGLRLHRHQPLPEGHEDRQVEQADTRHRRQPPRAEERRRALHRRRGLQEGLYGCSGHRLQGAGLRCGHLLGQERLQVRQRHGNDGFAFRKGERQ